MTTINKNFPVNYENTEVQPKGVENEIKLSISATQALYKNETIEVLNETLSGDVLKKSQNILSHGRMEMELGWLLDRFTINNSNTSAPGNGQGLTTTLGGPFTDTRLVA